MTKEFTSSTEERPVRRLIRSCATQEYFKDDGWTSNPEEARSFADSLEAAEVCAQRGLKNVELILRVDGGGTEVFCTPMS